ncbi:GxxExxY protein [Pedobacter sp. N23S346]|uniref:GxxExxY protein n=1 Tax=Pedobacter sp. N23S346 TaxID=3402750 RepID=UPI003AD5D7E0
MTENQVSYIIRGSIFRVYNTLGPGLLESAYEAALKYEIQKSGLLVRSQVILPMIYDEIRIDVGYRLDLLIEELVVVEIKSVEMISNLHHRQLITYLKLSGYKLGLLVNFNSGNIENGIFRKAYGL